MVYQELVNYIRGARASGYGDEDTRKQLSEAGWRQEDVDEAFRVADGLEPLPAFEKIAAQEKKAEEIAPPIVEQPQTRPGGRSLRTYEIARMQREGGRQTVFEKQLSQQSGLRESAAQLPQQPMTQAAEMAKQMGEEEEAKKKFSLAGSWVSVIFSPTAALDRARYHASYIGALAGFVVPLLALDAAVIGLMVLAGTVLAGLIAQVPFAAVVSAFLGLAVLAYAVQAVVLNALNVVMNLVTNVVYFAASKLLGGQGSFKQQLFLNSVAFGATVFLMLGAGVVLAAGVVLSGGTGSPFEKPALLVSAAISFCLLAYSFALGVLAIREAHLFSTLNAVAVTLAPLLLSLAVALVFVFFAGNSLESWLNEIARSISQNAGGNAVAGLQQVPFGDELPQA